MNSTSLARQYESLTPKERLPLIMKACLRDDSMESARLRSSAPRLSFRIPDYLWLGDRWVTLIHTELLTLVDLTATYLETLVLQTDANLSGNAEFANDCERGLLMCRYRFAVELEAWNHFCAENNFDGMAMFTGLPGAEIVSRMIECSGSVPLLDDVKAILPVDRTNSVITATNIRAKLHAHLVGE